MARFLGMLELTPEEAANMVRTGPVDRRDYLRHLVGKAGGTLEQMWLTNVGDWDVILLLDMPDETPAEGAAATLARKAARMTIAERWIQLSDVEDVALAIDQMQEATVPA